MPKRTRTHHAAPADAISCPAQERCGACQLLAVPYHEQLAHKTDEMIALFKPYAHESTCFRPISGMDDPFHYRNKVTSPYRAGKKLRTSAAAPSGKPSRPRSNRTSLKRAQDDAPREILCGMYAAGTHHIIPTDTCLLENRTAKRVVLAIKAIMQRYRMEPYDEDTGAGFIRHAIVRIGHSSQEVLVTIVTNRAEFPASRNFCKELVKRVPEITTIVQNVNTRQTNVILGRDGKTLYGPGFILDELCGLSFRISSKSFYQVNATQTEVLYRHAIRMAQLNGAETVLDAYCGTGTIGLVAAKGLPDTDLPATALEDAFTPASARAASHPSRAARVIGVDNVASAIKDARSNALHNGIDNALFVTADAGAFMKEQAARGESIDVVLMDPPRAGASADFLEALRTVHPQRIVYISCNPKTQERDAAFLVENGYRIDEVQPVDMFPHTTHIENVIALTRI